MTPRLVLLLSLLGSLIRGRLKASYSRGPDVFSLILGSRRARLCYRRIAAPTVFRIPLGDAIVASLFLVIIVRSFQSTILSLIILFLHLSTIRIASSATFINKFGRFGSIKFHQLLFSSLSNSPATKSASQKAQLSL